MSLRGGRRPTWRPEREARGSALGVQSREGSYVFAGAFLLSNCVLRDCHVASLLAMTNLGAIAFLILARTSRRCSAGSGCPLPYNTACGRRWLVRAATAFPRLPRRFAPRNDNLGECRGAPAPLHGLIPLYKALTARKGHAATPHTLAFAVFTAACTDCECLPEIATSLRSSQ